MMRRALSPLLLGPLRHYRPIRADAAAAAMLKVALQGHAIGVIESDAIARLAAG
jgi:hypothetical protein